MYAELYFNIYMYIAMSDECAYASHLVYSILLLFFIIFQNSSIRLSFYHINTYVSLFSMLGLLCNTFHVNAIFGTGVQFVSWCK